MILEKFIYGNNGSGLGGWVCSSDLITRLSKINPKVSTAQPALKNIEVLKDCRFIGLEFEIEGVVMGNPRTTAQKHMQLLADAEMHKYWFVTNDGSLRNAGKEFVSWKGLDLERVPAALDALTQALKWVFEPKNISISSRCSAHVHYNVWDYSLDDLRSSVLTYMFVERLMYLVSGDRFNNIFCVPCYNMARNNWSPLFNPYHSSHKLQWEGLGGLFHKYAGFNLKPIFEYGTIELRHHRGTANPNEINDWIKIIHELFTNSRKYTWQTWREVAKEYWDANELGKLVSAISPLLFEKTKHFNLNMILEPHIKFALWVSTNNEDIPSLDDDMISKPSKKKKYSPHELVEVASLSSIPLTAISLDNLDWTANTITINSNSGN